MKIQLKEVKTALGPQRNLTVPEFSIENGAHLLLQGASGLGKTTFLNLISGLHLPQSGSVSIAGVDITRVSEKERNILRRMKMGLVFQRLNLVDHLTVFENISLGFYPQPVNEKRIFQFVEELGLSEKIQTLAQALSLGEQQRVAVARAVIHSPSLILADEPTSSLDDHNTSLVMDFLKRNSEGKTLIMVSHDHRVEKNFATVTPFEKVVRS